MSLGPIFGLGFFVHHSLGFLFYFDLIHCLV